jgi:outer membrane receptor protein involved in Fe transport
MVVAGALLAPLFLAPGISAQTVPAPAAPGPLGDVVELSPFTVTTTEDRGYQAQTSLGGSRLKTNLKDIASPTTAFTQQFFEDFAITNTDELSAYMLSTEMDFSEDGGPAQNRLVGHARPLRMRGLAGGSLTVNFFRTDFKMDTFSTERIDQSRGPNSVLFGIGDPGGIINVSTRRALLDQTKTTLTLMAKSHGSQRGELDVNLPVRSKRVAIRVAAVDDRTNTWRNHEFSDERRGVLLFNLILRSCRPDQQDHSPTPSSTDNHPRPDHHGETTPATRERAGPAFAEPPGAYPKATASTFGPTLGTLRKREC